MKNLIVLLIIFTCSFCFGQDYLLQEFTSGGSDAIYGKRNMVADNNGNIYATGVYNGSFKIQDSIVTGGGIYLAKFTNDLSLIWLKKIAEIVGADAGGSLSGLKLMIALDSVNNVLIGYSAWGGSYLMYDDSIDIQTNHVELIKLDSFGTRLWRTSVTGSNRLGDKGVAVDSQNNIFITGKDLNDDIFITKYDEDGNEVWYNTAGVSGSGKIDFGSVVTIDNGNNVYTSGMLYSNGSNDTAYFDSYQIIFPNPCFSASYLAKYTSDGTLLWVRYVYSSSPTMYNAYGSSTITAIECFKNGNIAVGGYFSNQLLEFSNGFSNVNKKGNIGFRSSFLASFDSIGNPLWAKTLHNTTDGGVHIVDLSIDSDSSIFILNEYMGTLINELGNSTTVHGNASTDLLLERYDENGNLISSIGVGGNSNDFGYDIVAYGNSVFTYSTTGSQGGASFYLDTDSLVFNNGGFSNMVLLKLTENPTLDILENTNAPNIKLFPNPNNGVFIVLTPLLNSKMSIYNISGKLVYESIIQNKELINIDVQDLSNGIYFFNIMSDKFNVTRKFVKN